MILFKLTFDAQCLHVALFTQPVEVPGSDWSDTDPGAPRSDTEPIDEEDIALDLGRSI